MVRVMFLGLGFGLGLVFRDYGLGMCLMGWG